MGPHIRTILEDILEAKKQENKLLELIMRRYGYKLPEGKELKGGKDE